MNDVPPNFYETLFDYYLDTILEKDLYVKRSRLVTLVGTFHNLKDKGLIKDTKGLPSFEQVKEFDETQVGVLDKLLSSTYFPASCIETRISRGWRPIYVGDETELGGPIIFYKEEIAYQVFVPPNNMIN